MLGTRLKTWNAIFHWIFITTHRLGTLSFPFTCEKTQGSMQQNQDSIPGYSNSRAHGLHCYLSSIHKTIISNLTLPPSPPTNFNISHTLNVHRFLVYKVLFSHTHYLDWTFQIHGSQFSAPTTVTGCYVFFPSIILQFCSQYTPCWIQICHCFLFHYLCGQQNSKISSPLPQIILSPGVCALYNPLSLWVDRTGEYDRILLLWLCYYIR